MDQDSYRNLCRLCASKINLVGLHVFANDTIVPKISLLLQIQINSTDILPKMICDDCSAKLNYFYQFRSKAHETEQVLLGLQNEILSSLSNSEEADIHTSFCTSNDLMNYNDSDHDILVEDIIPADISNEIVTSNQSLSDDIIQNVEEKVLDTALSDESINGSNELNLMNSEGNTTIKAEICEVVPDIDFINDNNIANTVNIKIVSSSNKYDEGIQSLPESIANDFILEEQLNETVINLEQELQSTGINEQTHQVFYVCDFCKNAFEGRQKFRTHYRQHWLKCKNCTALFKEEASLNAHFNLTHKKDVKDQPVINVKSILNNAAECINLVSKSSEEINEVITKNKKNEHKKSSVLSKTCTVCGKVCRSNYKLVEHMRRHTNEQPFKCKTCGKGLRSKMGLDQHEAKHTGKYLLSCNICGKGFQCQSYLTVHQRVHDDSKPYQCTTCEQSFKSKQALIDHENRHLGIKPFACDLCGKTFITKGLLKSHQRTHGTKDLRQYPCTICNKLFVSKGYLSTHVRIHTGEKPFVCEVCGKGFLTRVDLRIHMTLHTGEKKFVCEACGKPFARKDALRCHIRQHTGERPYVCDICGQRFTQYTPMLKHKKNACDRKAV